MEWRVASLVCMKNAVITAELSSRRLALRHGVALLCPLQINYSGRWKQAHFCSCSCSVSVTWRESSEFRWSQQDRWNCRDIQTERHICLLSSSKDDKNAHQLPLTTTHRPTQTLICPFSYFLPLCAFTNFLTHLPTCSLTLWSERNRTLRHLQKVVNKTKQLVTTIWQHKLWRILNITKTGSGMSVLLFNTSHRRTTNTQTRSHTHTCY